jgi:hypothetical protein
LHRPKKNGATEGRGKILKIDNRDRHSLQNALTMSGHETRMGKNRNIRKGSVGQPKGKEPLGGIICEIIILKL